MHRVKMVSSVLLSSSSSLTGLRLAWMPPLNLEAGEAYLITLAISDKRAPPLRQSAFGATANAGSFRLDSKRIQVDYAQTEDPSLSFRV